MLKLIVALAGVITIAACGAPAPDRETPADEIPRRELELARVEEEPEIASPNDPSPSAPDKPASPPLAPKHKSEATHAPPPVASPPVAAQEPAPETETTAPAEQVVADSVPSPEAEPRSVEATVASPVTDSTEGPIAPPDSSTTPVDTAAYAPYPPIDAPAGSASPSTAAESVATGVDPEAGGILPTGTLIHATLEDSIHSRIDVSGKEVQGQVMENVTGSDGTLLIPAGSPVRFTVTQVRPGRGKRKGVLEMRTDSITIRGRPRVLTATIQGVPYELRGRGVTGEEAAKVGVGAAGGAVLGKVITGKTKGAVIGGVVGAAGGAVVASETAQKDVVVKARTPVELILTAPLPTR